LRKKDFKGKTIHLKLRYSNFSTITRNKTLPEAVDSTQVLFQTIKQLFEKNYQTGRRVRLLGIGIRGFGNVKARQLSLFDRNSKRNDKLDKLQDMLIDRFGKKIVSRAESLKKDK
jgi:predicted NBD/HSP70 family sugar kinase